VTTTSDERSQPMHHAARGWTSNKRIVVSALFFSLFGLIDFAVLALTSLYGSSRVWRWYGFLLERLDRYLGTVWSFPANILVFCTVGFFVGQLIGWFLELYLQNRVSAKLFFGLLVCFLSLLIEVAVHPFYQPSSDQVLWKLSDFLMEVAHTNYDARWPVLVNDVAYAAMALLAGALFGAFLDYRKRSRDEL
jgi:hypothetical protein